MAGLYLLILKVAPNAAPFYLPFEYHGSTAINAWTGPYEFPWSWKNFGCPTAMVIPVIMLMDSSRQIVGLAAIIAATWR